jgi:hypothetical protein
MIHAHSIIPRPLLVILALIGALLACTASLDSGDGSGGTGDGTDGGGAGNSTVPTVRILEPASGARLPANQRVDITVETDTPATSFLLNERACRQFQSPALRSDRTDQSHPELDAGSPGDIHSGSNRV